MHTQELRNERLRGKTVKRKGITYNMMQNQNYHICKYWLAKHIYWRKNNLSLNRKVKCYSVEGKFSNTLGEPMSHVAGPRSSLFTRSGSLLGHYCLYCGWLAAACGMCALGRYILRGSVQKTDPGPLVDYASTIGSLWGPFFWSP